MARNPELYTLLPVPHPFVVPGARFREVRPREQQPGSSIPPGSLPAPWSQRDAARQAPGRLAGGMSYLSAGCCGAWRPGWAGSTVGRDGLGGSKRSSRVGWTGWE